jgi:hypothetical protein
LLRFLHFFLKRFMIRHLFLATLLALNAGAVLAQVPGSESKHETFKQHLRAQYLPSDTAQALINLYSRRQAGGASWIFSSALAAARLATSSGGTTTTSNGYVVQDNSSNVGAIFLIATPIMGYGVSKLARFSNKKLETILTAYAAGQGLPRSTRRKLKPRFFNEPIIQYTPVNATPAK